MALRSRETWNALSPNYRARLVSKGITEERYLSGDKLTGARGHAATPEHPERAVRNPGDYPEYARKHGIAVPTYSDKQIYDRLRGQLIQGLIRGDIERVDVTTIQEAVRRMDTQSRIDAMSVNLEQQRERASQQVPKRYRLHPELWKSPPKHFFRDSHGDWINPFWYH